MDIYEIIAAKRPDILGLADRFAVKNIRIFGSVARQEATEKSDIDFLVEFPTGTSLLTHAAFQRETFGTARPGCRCRIGERDP